MRDTAPEINEMVFAAMMCKSPQERLLMGFDMMATARELVWAGIISAGDCENADEAQKRYFQCVYGCPRPW